MKGFEEHTWPTKPIMPFTIIMKIHNPCVGITTGTLNTTMLE